MKITTVAVVRNGETVTRLPQAQIKDDGTIWKIGRPLINITAKATISYGIDNIKAALKENRAKDIPYGCFAKLGENEGGMIVVRDDDRAALIAALDSTTTPAQKAQKAQAEKKIKIHISSRGWGDYTPVEWTGAVDTPTATILTESKQLLANGHDVDERNQTDSELIEKINEAKTLWTKKQAQKAKKKAAEKKAKEEKELRKSRAKMTTKKETIMDEGGKTTAAHHSVTLSGKTYKFVDRNVFDAGRCVNPTYEIAPGLSGGLANIDQQTGIRYWMTFDPDKGGWYKVRDMIATEQNAYEYVLEFGYYANSQIRM